jgi:hypothetical protein
MLNDYGLSWAQAQRDRQEPPDPFVEDDEDEPTDES